MAAGKPRSRISVIIPALNEASGIARSIASAAQEPGVEVIVVDGGSRDETVRVARRQGAKTLSVPAGRARQMNAGARASSGEFLVFLHADTILPSNYAGLVRRLLASPDVVAGAFRLGIEGRRRSLRWIETGANWRSQWLQLPYGDQALFVRSQTFFRIGWLCRSAHHGGLRLGSEADAEKAESCWLRTRSSLRQGDGNNWGSSERRCSIRFMVTGHLLGMSPRKMAAFYQRTGSSPPVSE